MRLWSHLVLAATLAAISLPQDAPAQALDVPIVMDCVAREAACYATSRVAGLRTDGDGFLAVRAGPGTGHRMIDKLHNGDVVEVITGRGDWRGVAYGNGARGWVHANWLRDLAG